MKKWLQRGLGFLLVCLLLIQGGSYSAQAQPAVVAHGLDVSQWQGDIDWARVAGEGISFVMFGLGRYQQPDPRFEENISEATAQGIQAGAYLRSQASTVEMAREEARYVVEQIQGYPISMPVAYDIEDEPQMNLPDNASRTDLVLAFCEEIREAGYYPMVYANEYWLGSLLDMDRIREAGIDVWQARYGSSYDESYGAAMWQYTSTGSVSGISGNVDRNYLFKDYTGLIPVRTQAEASWLEKNSEKEEAGEETPEKEDPPSSAPASGSWQKNQTGWWYRNGDGSYPAACWQQIDGSWYYFNSAGYMLTGWQCVGNAWYYLDGSGRMLTGWQRIGSSWYYLSGSGAMLTGWQYIGNAWYYLDGSGRMLTGWQRIGSSWYYLTGSGAMLTGWQQIGGSWYYLTGSGAMATGWQCIGNTWYYLDGSGRMLTGWQQIGGSWYYLSGSGAMLTGWRYIGNTWYYLDGSGRMLTGWQQIGGSWYYLDGSGHMLTGWIKLDNTWYYLYSNGAMASGCYVGSYYVNDSGAWVA